MTGKILDSLTDHISGGGPEGLNELYARGVLDITLDIYNWTINASQKRKIRSDFISRQLLGRTLSQIECSITFRVIQTERYLERYTERRY